VSVREIALIAGMVAVTFAIRYVPLVLAGRLRLPRALEAALRFVPVAVLTAITVPAVLLKGLPSNLGLRAAALAGMTAGTIAAALRRPPAGATPPAGQEGPG
jgi:branched-subunit amino acid transport protein